MTKFSDVVCYALDIGVVSSEELAGEYEVVKSTIERWAIGKTTPHPVLQKQVVKYIKDRLDPMITEWLNEGWTLKELDKKISVYE